MMLFVDFAALEASEYVYVAKILRCSTDIDHIQLIQQLSATSEKPLDRSAISTRIFDVSREEEKLWVLLHGLDGHLWVNT